MRHGKFALENLEHSVFGNPDGEQAQEEGFQFLCIIRCGCGRFQVVKIEKGTLEKPCGLTRYTRWLPLE